MDPPDCRRRTHIRGKHLALISNFCGFPAPERCPRNDSAKQLQTVVASIVASALGRSNLLQMLVELWPQIVGSQLASLCQPYGIAGKTLTIKTPNCSVAQEINLLSSRILERIGNLPNAAMLRKIKTVS
ncbi:MAG: DUF721 domain-containing protein [Puniceicoccales bacterium]|jgi:hypothetical protein|nr:DUF721 domain-containing protein [Puniceicoccales bacterium]